MGVSRSNEKMGAIPSWSFPPVVTCAAGVECARLCYARRMAARRPSVGQAWARNLEEWQTNPDSVKYQILAAAATSAYFRYFVGGDIPDPAFFALMVEIAEKSRGCQFLAFTKKYDIVNAFIDGGGKIPANLHIVFSEWGKPAPNPHGLPVSRVIFKGGSEPHGAKVCGGNCTECICKGIACWELKSGEAIYFHQH